MTMLFQPPSQLSPRKQISFLPHLQLTKTPVLPFFLHTHLTPQTHLWSIVDNTPSLVTSTVFTAKKTLLFPRNHLSQPHDAVPYLDCACRCRWTGCHRRRRSCHVLVSTRFRSSECWLIIFEGYRCLRACLYRVRYCSTASYRYCS